VAELGEVAPPQWVTDRLRHNPTFADVEIVPSAPNDCTPAALVKHGDRAAAAAASSSPGERMRRYAAQLGCDHLLLYGSTVDHSVNSTALSVADLTIVGAYVVPGQKINASARVAGSLTDVASGQVLLTVSADGAKTGHCSFAQRDDADESVSNAVKEAAIASLLDRLDARIAALARQR
jgi:hypothetical protein